MAVSMKKNQKRSENNGNDRPGVVTSQTALATACGVTDKTVYNWRKDPTFPTNQDGSFSVWAVAKWHSDKYPAMTDARRMEGFESGEATPALEDWRRSKAGLAELDLKERRAELIDRQYVLGIFALIGSRLRELGERLQIEGPASPFELLNEALRDVEQLAMAWVAKHFGEAPE